MFDSDILSRFAKSAAKVAELVDAPALGAGAERRESSSLSFRTIGARNHRHANDIGDAGPARAAAARRRADRADRGRGPEAAGPSGKDGQGRGLSSRQGSA